MAEDVGQGRLLVRRYRVGRLLGSGAHGAVHLGQDLGRGGEQVALKLVSQVIGQTEPGEAERVLQWFRHPNWAEVLDSGRFGPRDWFQALRYVPGRNLEQVGAPQPASAVWAFLEHGARVLGALHRQGLIHYDVTPGNFLMEDTPNGPTYTLTDGGLAHFGPVLGVARGSPRFMAPEISSGAEHDHRADLYSLGLVAYWLLTGTDPQTGGAGDVLGARRRSDAPRASTKRSDVPRELDEFLASLLARNPNERPTDALALLAALGVARGVEIPPFRTEEIAAMVAGGPLVGREPEVQRYAQSLAALASHAGNAGEPAPRFPSSPLKDSVLILRGPTGSGCTRLATQLASMAREADVLVLRLSGRGGADQTATLLPGLLECLGQAHQRRRAGTEGEPRHSTERDIERAISALERRARKQSILLLVDSFAHLPEAEKSFVRALSRHLQARMNPGSPVALPLLLLIDAGEEEFEQFVPVTKQESRTPEMALEPLSNADLLRVATQRLGALTLTDSDGARVAQRCAGLPGRLGSLLLEAHRHSDLTFKHGRFILSPTHIDDYTLDSRLAPAFVMALERLSPAERDFIQVLAGLPEGLSVPGATAVYAELTGHPHLPPLAPLLRNTGLEPNDRIQLAAPELRSHLSASSGSTEQERTGARALQVLTRAANQSDLLPTARLLAEAGAHDHAATLTLKAWGAIPAHLQGSARTLLSALAPQCTRPAELEQSLLAHVHEVLDGSTDSLKIVRALLSVYPITSWTPEVRSRALQVLESRHEYGEAFRQVLKLAASTELEHPERFATHVQAARLHLDLHQTPSARAQVRLARHLRRQEPAGLPTLWVIRYLTAAAQICFLQQATARAVAMLLLAAKLARRQGTPSARALVLNNLGIVLAQEGKISTAQLHLRRALRVRTVLGDIPGRIKTLVNLGRLHQLSRELVRAASSFQQAAALAVRHGLTQQGSQSLLLLARVYDAQANPRLAADAAHQSLAAGKILESALPATLAAWELGPIAASLGDYARLGAAVLQSAASARKRIGPFARGSHHLMMTRIHLHLGNRDASRVSASRAYRCRHDLYAARAHTVATYHAFTSWTGPNSSLPTPGSRPRWGEEARPVYRAIIAMLRTVRVSREPSTHVRRLPFTTLERPRSTTGEDRRLLAEAALRATAHGLPAGQATPLDPVERGLLHSGESWMRSRTLALSALAPQGGATHTAQHYSRAVTALHDWRDAPYRALRAIPAEHSRAWAHLATRPNAPKVVGATTFLHLQALAHVLSTASSAEGAPDTRTGAALRQVIRAAAQMKAGGSQAELLQDIVTNAREIIGARRVCILLSEGESGGRLQLARSAPAASQRIDAEDISSTVVQRVTSSRSPLLLHDVFDDHELMGRPSITSLSLRSILCVPLARGETLFGLLYADSDEAMGSFDGTDLEVLSLFAEHVAATIEANRLLASLQKSMEDLKSMQDRLVRGERLRTIGELSSSVAHEFNNLLTSILARVQLLQLQPLGGGVAKDLLLVEKACLDAAEVVRRLQTFSRQQREQHFADVDMTDIVQDAVEFLRPLWSTRRRHGRELITVSVRAPDRCPVRGDPTELREVMTNLLKNALDALPTGGQVAITVSPNVDRVLVTLRDTGVGIPTEIQGKVFDPFFTTKGERGTGLGLSICQQILERHAGAVRLQSELGRGTTVTVELPHAVESVGGKVPVTEVPAKRAPARVLVVDDDTNVLHPLCRFLEESGYTVSSAQSGTDALAAAGAAQPQIVVSDISMPGMDGFELCSRLRALSATVPVLLMSGRASGITEHDAKRCGASGLIAKPFALRQLVELIDAHVAAEQSSQSAQ